MKVLRLFLPSPLDEILVHRRVTPPALNTSVPIYTPGWREGLWKSEASSQRHNAMSPARAQIGTAGSGVERTKYEVTAPPTVSPLEPNPKWLFFISPCFDRFTLGNLFCISAPRDYLLSCHFMWYLNFQIIRNARPALKWLHGFRVFSNITRFIRAKRLLQILHFFI